MKRPTGPYRSPRNPRRFRVLGDKPAAADIVDGRVLVCEGLAKPIRGAFWRLVCVLDRGPELAPSARVLTRRALGFALIPADGAELDFVSPAGVVSRAVAAPAVT
ncbi:MAG: hypothetical protein ACYTFV_17475 [Planctomycetota bacterium]|jgi:hypothetical protein